MTRLRPITGAEYAHWRAQTTPPYAADKVRIGRWSPEEALAEAEKELQALLPQGLHTPGHHFFTIEGEDDSGSGVAVGVVWLGQAQRAFGPIGFVYDLVIWPPHRRQGHGAAAMRALEHQARRLGLHGLALHVFGHNSGARALYAALGYAPTHLNLYKPLPAPEAP